MPLSAGAFFDLGRTAVVQGMDVGNDVGRKRKIDGGTHPLEDKIDVDIGLKFM